MLDSYLWQTCSQWTSNTSVNTRVQFPVGPFNEWKFSKTIKCQLAHQLFTEVTAGYIGIVSTPTDITDQLITRRKHMTEDVEQWTLEIQSGYHHPMSWNWMKWTHTRSGCPLALACVMLSSKLSENILTLIKLAIHILQWYTDNSFINDLEMLPLIIQWMHGINYER